MHIRSSVGLEFFQLTSAWLFENFWMRILKSHNVYWFEDIWKQKQLNLSATASPEYQTICSEWINSYRLRLVRKPIPRMERSVHCTAGAIFELKFRLYINRCSYYRRWNHTKPFFNRWIVRFLIMVNNYRYKIHHLYTELYWFSCPANVPFRFYIRFLLFCSSAQNNRCIYIPAVNCKLWQIVGNDR